MNGRIGELLLILLIVFVLFGAGKLPKAISEIVRVMKSPKNELDEKKADDKN